MPALNLVRHSKFFFQRKDKLFQIQIKYNSLIILYFFDFRKRYDRAEKEFVEAKLCLHKKQERKELLTEHLAAIIEDCEVRKARKLNELMSQLELKKPAL